MISRRAFLATTGLAGLAAFGAARPAGALTYGPVRSEVETAYRNACRGDPQHAALRAERAAALAAEGRDGAEVAAILDAMPCPLCGCPLGRA